MKPMNATANKSQSKALNVISSMNEKLLESNVKVMRGKGSFNSKLKPYIEQGLCI